MQVVSAGVWTVLRAPGLRFSKVLLPDSTSHHHLLAAANAVWKLLKNILLGTIWGYTTTRYLHVVRVSTHWHAQQMRSFATTISNCSFIARLHIQSTTVSALSLPSLQSEYCYCSYLSRVRSSAHVRRAIIEAGRLSKVSSMRHTAKPRLEQDRRDTTTPIRVEVVCVSACGQLLSCPGLAAIGI